MRAGGSATHRWKALNESYNFALDLVPIGGLSKELQSHKVMGDEIVAISELLLGSPKTKNHSDLGAMERHREYYMGERWWLPPNPNHGESYESRVARGLS